MLFITEYRVYYVNDKHLTEKSAVEDFVDTEERFLNEEDAKEWVEMDGLPFTEYIIVKVLIASKKDIVTTPLILHGRNTTS